METNNTNINNTNDQQPDRIKVSSQSDEGIEFVDTPVQ